MAQLQNEQRQINAVLRDVSAYQRQMQALDTLKTKLAEEKKALEDARQSTRASQDETKRLTTAKEQHQQSIKNINAEIQKERKALDEVKAKIEAEGQETDELIATNEGALQQFDDEIERIDLEQQKALELTGVLERLTAQKQDAWSTGQIKDVVDELNQIMPSLNLEFDVSTGSLNKSMDEITGTIKGGYASDRLNQVRGKITETLREKDQYYEKFKEAAGAYREAKERLDAWERGELQDTTWSEVQSDYATAFKSMQDTYGEFSKT